MAKSTDHDMQWEELKSFIDMGEEEPESRFLGCNYTNFTCTAAQVEDILKQHPSHHRRPRLTKEDCNGELRTWTVNRETKVKGKVYDMKDFVDQCVDAFCELGPVPKSSLKRVKTLFFDESKDPRNGKYGSKRIVNDRTIHPIGTAK